MQPYDMKELEERVILVGVQESVDSIGGIVGDVSTGVGSVLHRVLPQLQPGHG